jgi:hypothetical protein
MKLFQKMKRKIKSLKTSLISVKITISNNLVSRQSDNGKSLNINIFLV